MLTLTPGQEAALNSVVGLILDSAPEIRLAGPAGTGKTTLMKSLVATIQEMGPGVTVVTPTNKAAKVLKTKGIGDAATLYARFFTTDEELYGKRGAERARLRFLPNYTLDSDSLPEGKLDWSDIIVVDEASMLTTWVLQHLKRMCDTLILVGDPHQLPPVGDQQNPAGYFCSAEPHVELTEVLRQAGDSPILELATAVRAGRFPAHVVAQLTPRESLASWARADRRIIAFTNKNRRAINMAVRQCLGHTGVLPKPGELLVCNDNVGGSLLNGTEVTVVAFDYKPWDWKGVLTYEDADGKRGTAQINLGRFLDDVPEGSFKVTPELQKAINTGKAMTDDTSVSFSYGYCITAHKAQGSEWSEVAVLDERVVLNRVSADNPEMPRRWVYTAITRAADRLLFVDYNWVRNASHRTAA